MIEVSVQGNVGCGKTSVLREIAKHLPPQCSLVTEDVAAWCQFIPGKNLLEEAYTHGRIFQLQLCILASRVQQLRRAQEGGDAIFVTERSIDADLACFVDLHREQGNLTEVEAQLCAQLHASYDALVPRRKVLVYLRCPPDVCQERVVQRNRCKAEVAGATLAYLRSLHDKHESWVEAQRAHATVHVLNSAKLSTTQLASAIEGILRELS